VTARYDQIADFYEQRSGKTVTDPATAALLDLTGDVAGLCVLEVACGQGRVARELARRGAEVTGLDISAALRYYREGWWLASNTGYRGQVGSSHRMISTYLNQLTRHGLVLDLVAEPPPDPETERRCPPDTAPVPFYLAARCLRR
jgi:SAM-dependent methyltransferase